MKKKGFTLVELLIVIAIIAMLMGILMPALSVVRKMAEQALCGTNLSGLYKAIQAYATQYEDDYPKGGLNARAAWDFTPRWFGPTERDAYMYNPNYDTDNPSSQASIGATLYLLIKYSDVGTKSFICRGDTGATEFKLKDYIGVIPAAAVAYLENDLTKAYDFGTWKEQSDSAALRNGLPPAQHYSYCYQIPYGPPAMQYFVLSSASQPSLAVLADRNPYLALNVAEGEYYEYGSDALERQGNSPNHDQDGQNVLLNNGSVTFQEKPYCGVNRDNIYTMDVSATEDIAPQEGVIPSSSRCYNETYIPKNGNDSVLLNEGVDSLRVEN